MKHLCLIIAFFFYSFSAMSQNYEWADFLHSDYTFYPQNVAAMTLDDEGNVYTLGTYERTRHIGEDTIRTYGGYSTYIMKHNPDGELQWINPIGSNTYDWAYDLIYSQGYLFASMFLQGDTVYHRDGKFKRSEGQTNDHLVIKLDLDGNLNDSSVFYFNSVDYTTKLEVVDTLIYLGKSRNIHKLNHNLEKVGQLEFPGPWHVTFEDFQNVNDTAVLFVGKFQQSISYQGDTVYGNFSGGGYATFYGLMNTNDSLLWMKSYGNVQDGKYLAYTPNSNQWYLAGSYTDDFELQGHTFPLTTFNGWHGYLASIGLDGQLKETGTIYPMGSASVEVYGLMAQDNRVFVYGKSGYGTVNYNQQDTIHTNKQRFSFLFKLNTSLESQYHTFIHAETNNADITSGVLKDENMYFGGRTDGSGAYMGCDFYETGGYFVSHIKDEAPDETPHMRFMAISRQKGRYKFNASIYNSDYHYWDYGDGTPFDSSAFAPIHQYNRKGEISVKLHAGNKCGESVQEKTIRIKGIGELEPRKSANSNLYLGHIKGVGFKPDATFKLISEDGTEKAIRETVFVDSLTYGIMVEFYDAPHKTYDLYMENGEDKDTLLDALEIVEYNKPEVKCEWLAPKEILFKRTFSFTLRVSNPTNTTAYSVPITVTCNEGPELEYIDEIYYLNDIVGAWVSENQGHFRTVTTNETLNERLQVLPMLIPAIPPRMHVDMRFNIAVTDLTASPPALTAYYDPNLFESFDFFEEPIADSTQNDTVNQEQEECPGSQIMNNLLAVFGIEPESEAGFNLASLGCVMYGYITETFGSLNGFGSSGYGGGNPVGTYTGNPPFNPGQTSPINMGALIYESLKAQNPEASEADIMREYNKIAETLPDINTGSGDAQGNAYDIEIEYPEDIVCLGDCDLNIKVIRENEDDFEWEIVEDGVKVMDDINSPLHNPIPLYPIPSKKDEIKVNVTDKVTGEEESFFLKDLAVWVGERVIYGFSYWLRMHFEVRESRDPNEKYTMQGYGEGKYIEKNQGMPYYITFENVDSATAPASEVFIYDTLDITVLDTNNFQWVAFGWNNYSFDIEETGLNVIQDIDTRPYGGNIIVRFEGNIDSTGVLTAVFSSLDTSTMLLTNNIMDGFLLPNKTAPEGEGFISYIIDQHPDLPHGTRIENKATIIFDRNDPIVTSTVFNTIDTIAPLTSIRPFIDEVQTDTIVEVIFDGSDQGAGIASRSIYVKENSGPFVLIANNYKSDTIYLSANYGDTLNFYAFAKDYVGNTEAKALQSEGQIIIKAPESSTEEFSYDLGFKVYPNPAEDLLYIEALTHTEVSEIRLVDISGKVIIREAGINELNVSALQSGTYILEVESGNNIYREPIIIK